MSWVRGSRPEVREPAVAGRFYEGNARRLADAVDGYVSAARAALGLGLGGQFPATSAASANDAPDEDIAGRARQGPASGRGRSGLDPTLRAIVVPHAGHVYSGPTAGFGFAVLGEQARTRPIRRVVMLGPAHYVPVPGIGWSTASMWATPLGDVPVASDLAVDLVDGLATAGPADQAHQPEHSLEVQVPFLQRVLGPGFAICPFLVGADIPEDVAILVTRAAAQDDVVVVVSTDLSHYLDHDSARARDDRTIAAVLAGDPERVGERDACGRLPLRGMLTAARSQRWNVNLLDARTSGDTAGDRDRVVGYASFAVVEARSGRRGAGDPEATDVGALVALAAPMLAPGTAGGNGAADAASGLSARERRELVALAREAIQHGLATRRRPGYDSTQVSAALRQPGAAFVTLRSAEGTLLGCIGSLTATRHLAADVSGRAFDAAFRDPRFPPLTPARAEGMRVSISVLDAPRPFPARDYDDLVARLPRGSGLTVIAPGRRATFLPVVWDDLSGAATFVGHLWRKAGLPPRAWPDGISLEIYGAQEFGE